MKFLKKLFPLLVIVAILLSVAIVPVSAASDDVNSTVGKWYFFDTLPSGGFRVEGRFLLPSYTYHGSYFYYDFETYRVYDVLQYSPNNGLVASNENGSVTLGSGQNVIPYNRLLYVDSLKDTYNSDNQSAFFNWIGSLEVLYTFRIDSFVIPYRDGDLFEDIGQYVPNIVSIAPYEAVAFKVNSDTPDELVYWENDLIYDGEAPNEFNGIFTMFPNSGGVLGGFGAISSWITSSLGSLDGIFYYQGALTPLGILCIIGLAIGIAFLLFNFVKNFLKLRS